MALPVLGAIRGEKNSSRNTTDSISCDAFHLKEYIKNEVGAAEREGIRGERLDRDDPAVGMAWDAEMLRRE
jgi:hypothetical protein